MGDYFKDLEIPSMDEKTHEDMEKHLIGVSLPPASVVSSIGIANSVGSSAIVAREDHTHSPNSSLFFSTTKGIAFPATGNEGDIFLRTDLNRFYCYTGGNWWRHQAANGNGHMGFVYTRVAALAVANITLTDIPWDTEITDSEASYAVPITTFARPADKSANGTHHAGRWNFGGVINWSAAPGAIGVVQIVNNTSGEVYTFYHPNSIAVQGTAFSLPGVFWPNGTTWKVRVYQNSAAARTVTGKFWGQWISP